MIDHDYEQCPPFHMPHVDHQGNTSYYFSFDLADEYFQSLSDGTIDMLAFMLDQFKQDHATRTLYSMVSDVKRRRRLARESWLQRYTGSTGEPESTQQQRFRMITK